MRVFGGVEELLPRPGGNRQGASGGINGFAFIGVEHHLQRNCAASFDGFGWATSFHAINLPFIKYKYNSLIYFY